MPPPKYFKRAAFATENRAPTPRRMTSPTDATPPGNRPAIVANIIAGTRLALLLPVRREDFRFSVDQAVVLVLLVMIANAAYYFVWAGPERHFDADGIGRLAALIIAFFFAIYLIARIQRTLTAFVPLVVVILSTLFVIFLAMSGFGGMGHLAPEDIGTYFSVVLLVIVLFYVWIIYVIFRCIRIVFDSSRRRTTLLLVVYLLVTFGPALALPQRYIWHDEGDVEQESSFDRDNFYAATVFRSQVELLIEATGSLESQRPGIRDLYFVGFGSYADQDVFWNEVRAVKALFDARFDTQSRSIVLVNNPETVDTHPLASVDNLRFVLSRVADRMDLEEDILFLFLTSHGSKNHKLSVRFSPLWLADLSDHELATILDESGIKWRVIVVSACYSGGFVDALKDDNSLIMTASDADRNSFGCSHRRKFTYFGESFFDHQLRQQYSFIEAFTGARLAIAEREQDEGLTPSLPQIHVGRSIESKLEALEQRLRTLD